MNIKNINLINYYDLGQLSVAYMYSTERGQIERIDSLSKQIARLCDQLEIGAPVSYRELIRSNTFENHFKGPDKQLKQSLFKIGIRLSLSFSLADRLNAKQSLKMIEAFKEDKNIILEECKKHQLPDQFVIDFFDKIDNTPVNSLTKFRSKLAGSLISRVYK